MRVSPAPFRAPALVLAFASVVAVAPVAGQSSPPPETNTDLQAPRGMVAHRLAPESRIAVDGRLDEDVWAQAPFYADWIQKEPVERAPAVNDSEVALLFDDEALYVGGVLYDEDPSGIARNMARRDAAYAGRSDYFEVSIDPDLDGLTGYRFRVTAGGVQTDRYLYEDDKEDAAWDAVYESAVTVDARGWIVEMRIPLSQIRYEAADTAQTWGIQFGRRRAADNELTRFNLESKLRVGRVSQFGRVGGLRMSDSPRRLEVLPYVVAQAHQGRAEPGDPFFDGRELDGRVGVDLNWGLGTAFTLDATLNPDFGQVEADPAVVNLTAFETFYQERRPFFVEDARVFDFSLSGGRNSLFYSRRVGREPHGGTAPEADFTDEPSATTILGAAKLTGRTSGGLAIGALVAVTQREQGRAYASVDGSLRRYDVEPRSRYGVVRLRQDFRGGQSWVGGIFTGMRRALPAVSTFDDLPSSAASAGVDFEHTWANRSWALWGFVAGSHVRGDSTVMLSVQRASNHYLQRPDLRWGALDPSATSLNGAEWRLQFERRAGHWTGAVWAAEVTSGFEVNDLGFGTSPERLDGGFRVGYQEVVPTRFFRYWQANLSTFHNFSHEVLRGPWSRDALDGAHTAGTVRLGASGQLRNFWDVNVGLSWNPDLMSRQATRGGPRMRLPGSSGLSAGITTDDRKFLAVSPGVEVARVRDGAGDELSVQVGLTLQPTTRLLLTVRPAYTWSTDAAQYVTATSALPWAPTYGSRYVFADLEQHRLSMTTTLNVTFSPLLSLEIFAQPLLAAADYATYKQLLAPETFRFDAFEEGESTVGGASGTACSGGRTCRDAQGTRWVDFDGDGRADLSFRDGDFNLRSLRSTAVLRWEYRPGSALFFVWQHRQEGRAAFGDFDTGRDLSALLNAPSDDVFIVKGNVWLSW